ncbi:MAG: GNAT family N-acyltransferase [Myxococcota bacterium]
MSRVEPVADPESLERMSSEVMALPAAATLVSERRWRVLALRAGEAPTVMQEIGRARERTFREVGEGSGAARDLDDYDASYVQLVLWDDEHGVVGGYRVGYVDELLARGGPSALYTSTGFRFERRLIDHLDTAVELGRSFVVPEHQRSLSALLLLWRGIGTLIARSDRHRLLLGAVSISAQYSLASREQIAAFLLSRGRRSPWAPLVTPRKPFAAADEPPADVRALEARVLERDGRKPPVLIRQYLQLGMRGLACGVDPGFGGCLDVLCIADLRDTPSQLLARYMGEEGARTFAARHDYAEVA